MSIKSPLLSSQSTIPTNQLPKIKSPNKGTELGQDSTLSGLLPPIDLSSQSSPMALGNRSSSTILERRINKRSEKKPATPEEDNDRTPVALPRRVHRLQLSDGTIIRAPSQSNESLDRLATDASTNVMDSLTNLPISNSNSSRTISAMAQHGTKQSDTINGRASPGISASLGRLTGTTTAEKIDDKITTSNSSTGIGRRNSFTAGTASTNISSSKSLGGGLKIPARIQQQQEALKRDLIAVREFAMSIDELKRLQLNHGLALVELKRLSEPQAVSPEPSKQAKTHVARSSITKRISGSQPSSPTTTTFAQAFSFARRERHVLEAPGPESQAPVDEASLIPEDQKIVTRAALAELNAHYAIWWECADLLIELGGAAPAAAAGTPVRSPTMPTLRRPEANESQSTPRASQRQSKTTNATPNVASITSTDPTSASRERRGSTGQQDLSIRQVQLLKDMLSTPDPNDLASNIDARLNREAPFSVLSPVISHGGSTVRTQATIPTIDSQASEDAIASAAEKEKKRGRRVSALAGKLGVKDILAGLKWAKEKALQRSRQTKSAEATTPPEVTGDAQRTDSSTRRSKENIASASQVTLDLQPAASKTSLAVADAPQVNDPPSPYKRSRRRSLASIFKFGNASTTQTVDQSSTRSKSRIDLTSPTFPSEHNGAVWDQNQGDHGHESDWDQLNSPSDVPGRNTYVHRGQNSNTDLLQSSNVRNLSSNGIPIPTGRRRGSTASRDASVSRYGYSSASASAASLANSSVYGSAASHFSLHESMSGRVSQGQHEEDRRRLKKPPSKTPRRPPSASGRKSKRSFSRGSPTGQVISPITSTVTSPNLDQSYHSPRSSSRHSHVTESGSGVPMLPSSTRSVPVAQSQSLVSLTDLSQPRLALTPENIVPLLVYAKEVRLKLADCLMELKALESDLLLSKPSEDDDLLDSRGAIEIEAGGTRW
ncbi:hypothetical protein FS842_007775 [Serendipita sp. 407]|nr:hypothetical protein FS842_007775 [Serendipita sp. 407]